MGLSATELAQKLNLSKGRISQYVSSGVLDGCFEGAGRQRRFDLSKVAKALGRNLDKGQLLGNGAGTQKALEGIRKDDPAPAAKPKHPAGARPLDDSDDDRYQLARAQKAEEEARRLRRQNAEAEGSYVLASEVALQVQKKIGQEIAEFESVLREAARLIADEYGLDFAAVRSHLVKAWRDHRGTRAEKLQAAAGAAVMTETEKSEDI